MGEQHNVNVSDEMDLKKNINLLQGYVKQVKDEATEVEKKCKNLHTYASKMEESSQSSEKCFLTADGTTVYIKGFTNMMSFGAINPLTKNEYFEVEFTNFK
uniref:Uncharacterized protein n=1 Tax=Meloidogyne floridensis TaxID=298350 RepID=A0A915NU13_9BILA